MGLCVHEWSDIELMILVYLILGTVVLMILGAIKSSLHERHDRSKMSLAERERYDKSAGKMRRKTEDDERLKKAVRTTADARSAIRLANSEGKQNTRVWVPCGDVEVIKPWAHREGYRSVEVKVGHRGDTQISFSNLRATKPNQ